MNELENLRPEVREAHATLDAEVSPPGRVSYEAYRAWCTIHAELLRLAGECAMIPRAQLLANFAAANERAERAEAERDELRTAYTSASQSRDYWKECTERAEAELEALKARIRGACLVPLTAVMLRDGCSLTVSGPMSVNDVDELAGKRVRLVVEE